MLDSYASERANGNAIGTLKALSLEQWSTLVDYAATHELGNPGRHVSVAQVLSDMTWCSPDFTLADFSAELRDTIVRCFLVKECPRNSLKAMPDGAVKRELFEKVLSAPPVLSGPDVEEVSTAPTTPIQASEVYPISTSAVEVAPLEQQAQYTSLPSLSQNIEFPHIPWNVRTDRNLLVS
ncbi:hypothetical protein MPER_08349 [Moniliophthora perniciosa FA553]|nr:hypothetical protein MPER_08349 [Moniliophthora perniciosa FA553]